MVLSRSGRLSGETVDDEEPERVVNILKSVRSEENEERQKSFLTTGVFNFSVKRIVFTNEVAVGAVAPIVADGVDLSPIKQNLEIKMRLR